MVNLLGQWKNTQKKNFRNYQEKWFPRLHELYLSKQSLPGLYHDFYFHLAGKNFELCTPALETIKKILGYMDTPKAPVLNGITLPWNVWKIAQKP